MPQNPPARPEELAFLQAIVENPNDAATYSALTDWLEDHDQRRAAMFRLHRRLQATCSQPEQDPERVAWQARLVELLSVGVRPCVPQQAVKLPGAIEMGFSFIPPGTFLMGSPPDEVGCGEDETLHQVTLTKGFWLGVYQVTQAQRQAVMGSNPSHFKGENLPTDTVSWEDCQEFCKKLTERDGKRYRLPTEAEWEYACRAGTTTPFYFGETISTDQANYNGDYTSGKGKKGVRRQKTTSVGSFPPNAWGLFDMHGNVWEWCEDWYGPYNKQDNKDVKGDNNGDARVLRGGSLYGGPNGCRSAYRGHDAPFNRFVDHGCRVVLCLD